MKRGPVIAASQSLRLIIQSVWRNVNKSELSLSLSICSFLSSSFVRRGEDYALRRTFGTQSITRALALPKFAEEKYLADRDPCGRGRAHVGEETDCGFYLAKSDTFIGFVSGYTPSRPLPFSPRRRLGRGRLPKRASRPPSPKARSLSVRPLTRWFSPDNDSGNCDKVSSPFLSSWLSSLALGLSFSRPLPLSQL